jgi:hypothetical protein
MTCGSVHIKLKHTAWQFQNEAQMRGDNSNVAANSYGAAGTTDTIR